MQSKTVIHAGKCFLLLLLAALVGCSHSTEQLAEVVGPNGIKAVWIKRDYGATTPFVYSLYVVASGSSYALKEGDELLRTDDIEGMATRWIEESALSISCVRGNIYKFENVFYINGNVGRIELQTVCGE